MTNILDNILDWLMPREYRSYWSHWFILSYFLVGACIHCPQVVKAATWPLIILSNLIRGA